MPSFTDESILLSADPYGEYDAIAGLLTLEHGLVRGVVKGGFSRKRRADTQPGTIGQATWNARLPEHLGTLTLEARHSIAARVMADPLKLSAVGSVMALLSLSLAERDPHPELYAQTLTFLQHAAAGTEPLIWLSEYVRLEWALLELSGFGLDLTACAATGTREGLVYVSPKSGRAVSRAAGAPYHAQLLPLPAFLRATTDSAETVAEIRDGLTLTGYFLESRMLPALHRKPPALRTHFVGLLASKPVGGTPIT